MKKLLFLVLLHSYLSLSVSAQDPFSIFKGFYTDDFFYVNQYLPNPSLYYITSYGTNIELISQNAQGSQNYAADSANGKLYKVFQGHLFLSTDTGKTFNPVVEPWGPDTLMYGLKGGENQGLFYFEEDGGVNRKHYKSLDGFQSYSSSVVFPLAVGMKPGAYYAGDIYSSSQPYLAYTSNWGNTFDTNYFTNPSHILLSEVHADHNDGQLYRIFADDSWHFGLFFSPDYGSTWIERVLPDNGNIYAGLFAAGRDNCTFYILSADEWIYTYYTFKLHIWVSRDCGETFTKITHELPTYVGLGDDNEKQSQLIFSPNPAGNYTSVSWQQKSNQRQMLQIFGSTGQLVLSKDMGLQTAGNNSFSIDVHTLTNGIYQVKLLAENGEIRYGKLVVCR